MGYARYSTSNQNAISIQRQMDKIAEVCGAENYDLIDFYADEAESGTNTDRKDFQRLLRDARGGRFDAVIIYDMFRGSRDIADWFNFRKEMRRLGVQVISASERLGDIDNPGDFLHEGVNALFGQMHIIKYRKDSIDGSVKRAKSGMFCGGTPPLGYDVERKFIKAGNKTNVESRYVLNQREAPVVRMIFEMYAAGSSYSAILAEVDKSGITGKFGQHIERNTLYYILKNVRYTGTFLWGEYEMRHMRKWVGRKRDEKEQGVIRKPGAIPQIVPQHIFDIVQERLRSNKRANNSSRTPDRCYLLSGLIRCGICGAPMVGYTTKSKGHEYKRYGCTNNRKFRNCGQKHVNAEKLEEYLLHMLRSRVLIPEYIEALVDRVIAGTDRNNERSAIAAEIQSLDSKQANLLAAIELGSPPQLLIDRVNDISQKRELLKQCLDAIPVKAAISRASIRAALADDVRRAIMDPRSQKDVLSRYFSNITVFEDAIEVVLAPDLARFTAPSTDAAPLQLHQNTQNNKAGQQLSKVVTLAGSPGGNYATVTTEKDFEGISESEYIILNYRIDRSLVA